MKIIVNAHKIKLEKEEIINAGEYNIQECNFEFSEEYENLVKVAIFSSQTNSYKVSIGNSNKCIIPYEVLENENIITIGVYGYEVNGEELIKRYSPSPEHFQVEDGSYRLGEEVEPPSPSIIEQIEQQISELSDEISTINDIIPTLALKSEIPTKTSQLTNDSNFAYESDIPDVSNFITKDVNNLTYYTKTSDLSAVATSGAYSDLSGTPNLSTVATTGDYDDLLNKPTIPVVPTDISAFNNDVGYVTKSVNNLTNYTLKTSTGSLIDLEVNSSTYVFTLYLKDIDGNVISTDAIDLPLESVVVSGSFDSANKKIVLTLQNGNTVDIPVGDLVAGLQTEITTQNKLASDLVDDSNSGNKFVTSSDITNWNNKIDSSALTNYVKNTDYATGATGGVFKTASSFNTAVSTTSGILYALSSTYSQYQSKDSGTFISKGTLENVITGKNLETANNKVTSLSSSSTDTQYPSAKCVYDLIGDINTVLDNINGEVI